MNNKIAPLSAEAQTIDAHIKEIYVARGTILNQIWSAGFIIENPNVENALRKSMKHMDKAIKELGKVRKDFS